MTNKSGESASLRSGAESGAALVLAAHGDRGDAERNGWLATHADCLAAEKRFAAVIFGVLKGAPSLENALQRAQESGARLIAIYPVFMSEGYFVGKVLSERVAAARPAMPVSVLTPLGLDPRLPGLLLDESLKAAERAGYDPGAARLLVVGHGSKYGPANAAATRDMARAVEEAAPFASVETAFLEETPFLEEALRAGDVPTVVAGFFSGEGMHAGGDVPSAIAKTKTEAVYTGAIGVHEKIPALIASSVSRFLADAQ